METTEVTFKKSLLKISHGLMSQTGVSALCQCFLLTIKTVESRAANTMCYS